MLVPIGDSVLDNPVLVGTAEAMLWEVAPPRQQVLGAIGLENCTFRRCEFRSIGWAGPPELIEKFRGVAPASV